MQKNASLKVDTEKLTDLRTFVENGQIKVPRFQRDYVWDVKKAAALMDSIIKGYPIGSLIYWRTDEVLKDVRNLGRIKFKELDAGERVNYVLDGQQRLTTIIAALFGETITLSDGKKHDFSTLKVHITPRENYDDPIIANDTEIESPTDITIPLTQLWEEKGEEYDNAYASDCRETVKFLRNKLHRFEIPVAQLSDADISVATDVFSRVNTGGKPLSVFEIMVAKTYDPNKNFDLLDKWEKFSAQLPDEFNSIPKILILQLIALTLGDDCKKSTILNLDRNAFIDAWPTAIESLKSAIDFLRDTIGIPASKLLPYPALIVPIAGFFDLNKNTRQTPTQGQLLKDFFWRAGWSERYSASAESNLTQDYKSMRKILNEKRPKYDWIDPINVDYIIEEKFTTSGAFSKTILALLATLEPKSYDNNAKVNLRNDWMQRANSKNFHHIFPKKYLRKQTEEHEVNLVLNISLIDQSTNLKVGANAPSKYMTTFRDNNDKFSDTMRTHLINTEDNAAIWEDDYDAFIDERAKAVIGALNKNIITE